MAKIIKKIRIAEYDVLKNEFRISFKLADITVDHLSFTSTFSYPGIYGFAGGDEQELEMLGLDADDIQRTVEEIFNWMEKPRKALDGLSHGYTMRSRFEATKRLEAERRGKAAVERIQAETPCLDWAMSVIEGLVDEENYLRAALNADSVHSSLSPSEELGVISKAIKAGYGTPTSSAEKALFLAAYPNWTLGMENPERVGERVAAISERIAGMEALGFGEKPVRVDINVVETPPIPSLSELSQSVLTGIRSKAEIRDEYNFAPPRLPTEDIDKAVNAIHKHFRRFMTPASMREHDFLRSIIKEEIEKVVGGVL